jgi:hypothetical protein
MPEADEGSRSFHQTGSERDHGLDEPDDAVEPHDGDEIGYCKPPLRHRWSKGSSGNPSDRKKGSKNKKTIIIRLMEQKLGRKIDDLSKLTRYEALLLKGIQRALSGDTRAMAFILRRYDDAAERHDTSTQTGSEQDEAVYAALVEKIRHELKEAG